MVPEPITLSAAQNVLIGVYVGLWSVFALLGARRFWLLWLHRAPRRPEPASAVPDDPPRITVQLPVYNERYVIRRLIRAVAALDWPRDRLEIQVLDDSTDDTVQAAAEEVDRLRGEGLDIVHLRRPTREGYKAGALAWGLARAKGELLVIFDADFVPRPDLLRRIVPQFGDPSVGMVQVRWDHLNADYSLLARVQAIALDGHFVVEHEARSRHGLFFNFNGTAGAWRKACIEDAGGWQHDTLTEDLDLSYRAQLKGWRFAYLRDVTCPSELPVDMRSFKSQQFRWTKGSAQVARKILPQVWRSDLSLARKLELFVHLTQNMSFVLVLALSLCVYPAVLMEYASGWIVSPFLHVPLIFLATFSVVVFYGAAVAGARRSWVRELRYVPALMSVAIGLSVSNTHAILEGLCGKQTPFHRTAKFDVRGTDGSAAGKTYRGLPSWTTVCELALAAYFTGILAIVVSHGLVWGVPFVLLFLFGYLYVGLGSAEIRLPATCRTRMTGANPAVSVVIPALNEEDSLPLVLDALPREHVREIVVVDNGSTDGTARVAREKGARVVSEPRRGYGQACLTGIAALTDPDIVAFLDADFSDHPEELPDILAPIQEDRAELVIGSRMLGRRERGAVLPQALFGNWLATRLIRLFWGARFTDLGPFRAIRSDALRRLEMSDRDFGWTVEMQVKAVKAGLRCVEVPVSYRRRVGHSKITGTFRGTCLAAKKILGTIFRAAWGR